MRKYFVSLAMLSSFLVALFLAVPATSQAQDLSEGMSQGDFALWLVKAIGAQAKLPPAAQGEDAIKFLSSLGVIPEAGWKKGEPITKEMLAEFVDDPGASSLDFDKLVEKVRNHVQTLFDNKKLGVFRVQSTGTPSVPA